MIEHITNNERWYDFLAGVLDTDSYFRYSGLLDILNIRGILDISDRIR